MSIAQRLEELFAQTAGPRGRPVTMKEIIDRMEQRGISTMSMSYLQQVRKGDAKNLRLQHVQALADAFGVPASYLTDDDASSPGVEQELTPLERTVALRVHGLSNEALSTIQNIIELARKSEQLDDPPRARGE